MPTETKTKPTSQDTADTIAALFGSVNRKEFENLVKFVSDGFRKSNAEFRRLNDEIEELKARLTKLEASNG